MSTVHGLRGQFSRSARLLGALVIAFGIVVAGALPAQASSSWRITRYDVDVVLDDAGTARVTVDLTFDLAGGGHGPLLTLVTRHGWDAEHDRTYAYDDIEVTSPTAPDDLDVRTTSHALELRIGDPDVTVRGTHEYTLTYTARGLVNGASSTKDGDQLYWNVLTDVSVPIENLAVTVRAPGPVTDVVCHAGRAGRRGGCSSESAKGKVATFTADRLPVGGAMTVVAVTPAGTLGDPAPRLEPTTASGAALRPFLGLEPGEELSFGDRALSAFAPDALVSRVATTVLGGTALVGVLLLVRRGRDRGTSGADRAGVAGAGPDVRGGTDGGVGPLPWPAAEIGVLVDGRADPRDLLAAVLDLARLGHVRIETTGESRGTPLMVRTLRGPDDGLSPFARAVLVEACPAVGQALEMAWTVDELAARSNRLRAQLDADVTARGWFTQPPGRRRARWWAAGRRMQRVAWWGGALVVVIQVLRGTDVLVGAVWWCVGLWILGGIVRLVSRFTVGVTAQGAAARREIARYRREVRAMRVDPRSGGADLAAHVAVLVALGDEKVAVRAAHALAATGGVVGAPGWAAGWEDPERFYDELPRYTTRLRRDLESEQRRRERASSSASDDSSTHGSSGGSGRSGSSSSGSGTGGGSAGGW